MKKLIISTLLVSSAISLSMATPVKVTMNARSKTMTLVSEKGATIDIGNPDGTVYNFDAPPGKYTLTGVDGQGVKNGTIDITITDETALQEFNIFTVEFYTTNKNSDNSMWQYGVDYSVNLQVMSRHGDIYTTSIGDSSTEGRKSVLCFSGNTLLADFIPSPRKAEEGYMTTPQSGTITFNSTISCNIAMGSEYTVTLPKKAEVEIGTKRTHFTDFTISEPLRTEADGDLKKVVYRLANNGKYNLRTWKEGGLTQALTFTKSADSQVIEFTENDYTAYNPKQVNHDPTSNQGYETGNIFVNINERGHLTMNIGDTFDAHAMRSWELTNTQVDNYFFEPDFHYTIIDVDGNPSKGVIEISSDDTTSSWRTIKAIGKGTAIVLVTYDAISVTRDGKTTPFMGGQYWGAIWPENTAAYVVTVGEGMPSINANLTVNTEYNTGEDGTIVSKLAGENVDAEHDVFYYLDTESGYQYTFKPEGVKSVTIAYPEIGENSAFYSGFGSEGVSANSDGSYSLLLKYGRNIVRLTDAEGKSLYQIMNAKPCHREISNLTHTDSEIFYPGDQVKIQYTGLHHPANKLAGVYNMSAYVTYNGTPNGTSLILGAGQYTFGSAPAAQAIELTIPEDYDTENNTAYILKDGVIQVSGFGDPIGAHRYISKVAGRSPNFTAVALKSYWGAIPEIRLNLKNDASSVTELDDQTSDITERWFNLSGLEIRRPESDQHGIYIRVRNGKSTKIRI